MTGLLALHGIAKFDVRSKTASQRLRAVHTAEGELLPRAHERLEQIQAQIAAIEMAQRQRLRDNPEAGLHPMILLLARVCGLGLATAVLMVREVLTRNLRDRRAVAR
jgi:transposase